MSSQCPRPNTAAATGNGGLTTPRLRLVCRTCLDEDPPFVAGNFENGYDESLDHDQRPVLVRRAKEEILKIS